MADDLAVTQHGGARRTCASPLRGGARCRGSTCPRERSRSSVSNSLSASCGVSTEVGSSRMMSSRRLQQAADDLDALALADRQVADQRIGVERQAVAVGQRLAPWRRWCVIGVLSSSDSAMFSAAVSASNSEKCWNTMPMPSFLATLGLVIVTGSPFQTISPEFGSSEPNSIFTSVDLPAPFSPSSAWISPLPDRQVDVVAGLQRAEDLRQAAHLEQVRGRCRTQGLSPQSPPRLCSLMFPKAS